MQRLATAQGKTISTQQRLADEKARLEKAKKELADVEQQQKELKKSEKTDKLVQALEKGDDAVGGPALWACALAYTQNCSGFNRQFGADGCNRALMNCGLVWWSRQCARAPVDAFS
jgi:hypothetical protein